VSALQRGSFDVIVNGLEPTGDRAKQIQFRSPTTSSTGVNRQEDEQQINSLAAAAIESWARWKRLLPDAAKRRCSI